MNRIPLSTRIDENAFQLLDQLTDELGPPKNRILEAGIELFAALPTDWQFILKSNKREDRALCLDLIRAIGPPVKQEKLAPKTNSAKSG